ncbi:MAG: serine/threonine-protein kinase [Gemmataceae bacterium]|nr:serine/threonine-protein kinase [Gemmataceae bacterium]
MLEELGRGGMGVVYKARQTTLNRVVALKMVLSGAHAQECDRLRFLAEAEAVAAVKHPNVVQVYEFGVSDNLPYFAMEYLDGGSLSALLGEHGRLPAGVAARVVEQVARGVQAAHDVGVIHRDLKPGNILFANAEGGLRNAERKTGPHSELLPKVTDFGLAKRGGGYDLTLTGAVMGTPQYMAPEQAKGAGKFVGPAADIYALGVILYECLADRPPFTADEPAVVLARVVADDQPPLQRFAPDVPRDLELICLKCLDKLPSARYPSAGALADDLRRFLAGEPVSVRPPSRLEKCAKWVRRDPSRAALYGLTLLASALIGLTAGVVNVWRQGEFNRRQAAELRAELENANAAVKPTLTTAVSPDGMRVASVSPDGRVVVREAMTGRGLRTLRPSTSAVAVGWNSDGSKLVVLDAAGNVSTHVCAIL